MYTPEQNALLEKVEELKREKGISQNEVGKLLGISGTALSQIKSGKYPADPQKIFETISNYFGVKEKSKLTYTEVKYAPTSISRSIYDIISICQIKGGLAVVGGDAGIGKTKTAQKFVEDHPTNSILITVNQCFSSIKSLLKIIAERLGASSAKSRDELWLSIVRKLSDGMILIFDEAQHIPAKCIDLLRSFSDHFNDRGQTLGICFIGNLDTVSCIGSRRTEFAQIANRTKLYRTFFASRIQRDDIKLLLPILEVENKDAEIDFLYQIAKTPDALRGVINIFSNAYDNDNYSYEGLVAAAKFMASEGE